MSKLTLLITCVIALVILNLGLMGAFMLKGGKKPPRRHQGHMQPTFLNVLNFDENQNQQFIRLAKEHRISIDEVEQKMLLVKKDLYQYLKDGNSEKKDSIINVLGNLQVQIENIHFDHFLEVKNLCSPDQLNNFDEFIDEITNYISTKHKGLPPPHKRPRH